MEWQDIMDSHKQKAAELIGMIDSGERWIFEHSNEDSNFHGFILNKILLQENNFGVISAAYYADGQRISIAFDDDLPACAESITMAVLESIVKSSDKNTFIWCKN